MIQNCIKLHYTNDIEMIPFKIITLNKDLYWNSKLNIPLSKINLQEGNFLQQICLTSCHEMYF
jgi:hypothetical protein